MASGTTDTPQRGRPRDPRRDEAILDAAFALLTEHGFERTSVEAIAQRAGVGKPTIYRRWPEGKAQLVLEALRRHRPERPVPDTGSLREDLVQMVLDAAAAMAPRSQLIVGLACQMRQDPALAALMRDHLIAEERALWRGVAERAHARGELPGPPTDLFCDLAPSLLHGRITMTSEPVGAAFAAALVDEVLLPVLHHHHDHG